MHLRQYGLFSEEEYKIVQAKFQIAVWMNLIESTDLEALEVRRQRKNHRIQEELQKGTVVYGLTYYSPAIYLQYELTRLKLDFVTYKGTQIGPYICPEITLEQKQKFYQEQLLLFARANGDSFSFEEVEQIIEKRLKEKEYENLVQSLLC